MSQSQKPCRFALAVGIVIGIGDPLGIYNHSHHRPFGKNGPEVNVSVLSPTKVLHGGAIGDAYRKKNAPRPAPSRRLRFDAMNLVITTPRGPWMRLDPKQTGSQALYLARRRDSSMAIALAGERPGVDAGEDSESVLAESQEKMTDLGAEIEGHARPLNADGVAGVAYEATILNGRTKNYYAIWVAAHNGYCYKLAVYGDQKNKPAIDATLRELVRGMKQIQPAPIVRASGNEKTLAR